MRSRCLRPADKFYADYGGRGVTIDPAWDDFERFVRDMGMRPDGMTLDRIENDKGYSKANCQWSDATYQGRNRRNSKYLTHKGERKPMIVWASEIGIKYDTLRARIASGWSVEDALTRGLNARQSA
jgi:hypothetical protein